VLYGYARVSSKAQGVKGSSLENQREYLLAQGVPDNNIVSEVASAVAGSPTRPLLTQLLARLEQGDTLHVYQADRLGREAVSNIILLDGFDKKGIAFVASDMAQTDDLSASRLHRHILMSFAEHESAKTKIRQRAGIDRARLEGKYMGRSKIITAELRALIQRRLDAGFSVAEIARGQNISRSSIYRHFIIKKVCISKESVGHSGSD